MALDLDTFLPAAVEVLAMESTADRPDLLHAAVDFVVDFVGPGFRVERFEANGKPSALLYADPGPGPDTDTDTDPGPDPEPGSERPGFRMILNSHLDVVPGEPEQFRPRLAGDRLYARGAQDMKISALVQAQVFRELAGRLPFPLALQLVADEEVGGANGTLHQIQQGVTGEFVIIGEHSRLDIVADSKGHATARLVSTGRAGHGAYPWLGHNALLGIVHSLAKLSAAYPEPDEEVWRTTLNPARIQSPNRALNQIPAAAEAWLDIRFPGEDTDFEGRTAAEVAEHLQAFCEPGVTVVVDRIDSSLHTSHDHTDVKGLIKAAQGQGYPADFIYKHGASDANHYASRGMSAAAFGVGGMGQHGPDEYCEIPTIAPYYSALREFLSGIQPSGATTGS